MNTHRTNKKKYKSITEWLSFNIFCLCMVVTIEAKEQNYLAQKRWQSFYSEFKSALKLRDKNKLRPMMAIDIYFSGGGGDDNHDGDTRDEAFKFWDDTSAWDGLWKALQPQAIPTALWRTDKKSAKNPSRIAPPQANQKGNHNYKYYAFFEYRNGKWYCTIFNECCD